MFDDTLSQGIYPNVGSGYRSKELQQQLYDAEIVTYQNKSICLEEYLNAD